MTQAIIKPREVVITPELITIQWEDGHTSPFPHRYLRSWCSCAHCVQEGTGQRIVGYDDVAADVQAVDWLQIGRYALQFLWSDAHYTGIYPFDVLRKLCTCGECVAAG